MDWSVIVGVMRCMMLELSSMADTKMRMSAWTVFLCLSINIIVSSGSAVHLMKIGATIDKRPEYGFTAFWNTNCRQ